jgi:hypothetical protein
MHFESGAKVARMLDRHDERRAREAEQAERPEQSAEQDARLERQHHDPSR